MFDFPRWKIIFTIAVILLAFVVLVFDYSDFFSKKGIKLGLDLQGGTSLVLQADEDVYLQDYTKSLYESVISILDSQQIKFFNIAKLDGKITFNLVNMDDYAKFNTLIFNFDPNLDIYESSGLVSVAISDKSYNTQLNDIMNNSMEIVRNRIDQTGTNEPNIRKQGKNKIIVELPGVDDPEKIKRLLGKTARLTFHKVDSKASFSGASLNDGYKFLKTQDGMSLAIRIEPEIYGQSLVDAKLKFDDQKPVVYFSFNTQAGQKFAQLTSSSVGELLAIVIDNKIISAPRINSPITGGNGVITGGFSVASAQELAIVLKSGSLPLPLNLVEERTIGPTLGMDSILNGLISGLIGYMFVFIFMIVYYKKLGLLANIALIFNTILIFAMFSIIGATLTLPGIAGIILTIGMAVDSNILVYERLNQEVINNKNINYSFAMSNSFKRVFLTIFDSNITTLFVALFLFSFGSGPIRGFAVALIVGIFASIFSIMFITKALVIMFFLKNTKKARI
jgi:preprotein translocase subunit SecD